MIYWWQLSWILWILWICIWQSCRWRIASARWRCLRTRIRAHNLRAVIWGTSVLEQCWSAVFLSNRTVRSLRLSLFIWLFLKQHLQIVSVGNGSIRNWVFCFNLQMPDQPSVFCDIYRYSAPMSLSVPFTVFWHFQKNHLLEFNHMWRKLYLGLNGWTV